MTNREDAPEAGGTPSPDEIAKLYGLPLQRALIDFDLSTHEQQVIGGDPVNLTGIPHAPVKTLITEKTVVTIVGHQEEAQEVADMLAANPHIVNWAAHYAEGYLEDGVMDFALNAMTKRQIRNIERHTGRRISEDDE